MSTYVHYELLRAFRNARFFVLSLAFPLILYLLIAGPNRNVHNFQDTGLSEPLYYMVGLAAFATMMATTASGARIAAERAVGWHASCGSRRSARARISSPRSSPPMRWPA